MKTELVLPMNTQIYDIVFPGCKIKMKKDFLTILIEVCRYILNFDNSKLKETEAHKNGYIHLLKERVSRLFFIGDYGCYSIGFPFTISICSDDNSLVFSRDGITLQPIVIAGLLQILKGDEWESTEILDFANPIDDWQSQLKSLDNKGIDHDKFWTFFRNLMMYDIGYVRYDYDPNRFNPKNPKEHPLHHIHGGYDGDVSYRIGFDHKPSIEEIKDVTNPDTDSWMIIQ